MKAVQSNIVSYAKADANARTATETGDRIAWIKVSLVYLPLATPVSDAKVLTGRQKPLTEIAFIFAEIIALGGLYADLEWGYVLAFAFFIIMMFVRPQGLLARRS